jgi:2-oxoglutarate ferredoxin oxidoreductase subunit alpha
MTATSGPGFALMTELITHGVMAEIPAVIIDAQRGGPATGLPTKTEQSDLHAAVFGGPGDSPRIVLAPTNVLECYLFVLNSFKLAEIYQTPVIVLTDFFLDNRVETVTRPVISPDDTNDANVYPSQDLKGKYRRYAFTGSGISPRSIPGMEGFEYAATGLEHTEAGIPNYDSDNHMKMSAKRLRKILGALGGLPEPRPYFDQNEIDVGVISWGSTFGSALESVHLARSEGIKAAALKVLSLFPYHAEAIREFCNRCKMILIPELNLQGQLANLIGHLVDKPLYRLNEVTGVPMQVKTIFDRIQCLAEG